MRFRYLPLRLNLIGICFLGAILQNQAYCDATNNAENLARGAKIWTNNCGRCHNYRAPSEFSPLQWHTILLHMRIQAELTGQEERDIYDFLTSQSNQTNAREISVSEKTVINEKSAASSTTQSEIETGKKIYQQTCIACHGPDGSGAVPGAPNFRGSNSPLLKSQAVLRKHIENGFKSPNSPIAMPPKGGNPSLTEAQINAVLDYMEQNFHQ